MWRQFWPELYAETMYPLFRIPRFWLLRGQCNHINHVSTQIPYAMTVAACCLAGYLAGGIAGNGWVALATGLILEVAVLAFILRRRGQAAAK